MFTKEFLETPLVVNGEQTRNAALLRATNGGKRMSSYFCKGLDFKSDFANRQLFNLQSGENQRDDQHAKCPANDNAARTDAGSGGTGQGESG